MRPKAFRAVTVLFLAAALASCDLNVLDGGDGITGSGDTVRDTYDLDGFTAIEASNSFEVEVTIGDFAVEVTSDDNIVDRLVVEVDGNSLVLGVDGGVRNATLEASVSLPELREVRATGASDVLLPTVETPDFRGDLSGASSVTGDFIADELDFGASGSSSIEASGTTGRLVADLSGSSELLASELEAEDADVSASGASNAEVQVSGSLDVDASGASDVRWSGTGDLGEVDSSGASSVERADR